MRKIYMIMGSKGSYEDFADWVEKCYLGQLPIHAKAMNGLE